MIVNHGIIQEVNMWFSSLFRTSIRRVATESKTSHLNNNIAIIKNDIYGMKSDIIGLKSDIKELNQNITELFKQNTNNTRLILGGFFGFSSAAVGVKQYSEHNRLEVQSTEPDQIKAKV